MAGNIDFDRIRMDQRASFRIQRSSFG